MRKIPLSERPLRNCEFCGKPFPLIDKRQRFCTPQCVGFHAAKVRGHVGSVEKLCRVCGAPFMSKASDCQTCCSAGCRRVARNKQRPPCVICGRPVRKMCNKYCSKKCEHVGITNESPHSYTSLYVRAKRANPVPQPCEQCGRPGRQRHHSDYSKPEQIVWLCVSCHKKLHANGLAHGRVGLPIKGRPVTDDRLGQDSTI